MIDQKLYTVKYCMSFGAEFRTSTIEYQEERKW